MKKLVKPLNLH